MEATFGPLLPLFERERSAGRALALGVLLSTAGSTYRKPGALILIAANGDYAGLLSGGCLEGDLGDYARTVIDTRVARSVHYDLRGGDDLLWGLGLGCEGAMDILLIRAGPENDWQPLTHLCAALVTHTPTAIGVVSESTRADLPAGSLLLPSSAGSATPPPAPLATPALQSALERTSADGQVGWIADEAHGWKLFILPLSLPPRILLLGAGPDALPVVEFAERLNWKVTLVDHRPAYAVAERFPAAARVLLARPQELAEILDLSQFRAAVVMTHHLEADLGYLRALAPTSLDYIGLLGPAVRRARLLSDLGADAQRLHKRLRAPVGLPLGGRTPESIALAIIAELHAFMYGVPERAA